MYIQTVTTFHLMTYKRANPLINIVPCSKSWKLYNKYIKSNCYMRHNVSPIKIKDFLRQYLEGYG